MRPVAVRAVALCGVLVVLCVAAVTVDLPDVSQLRTWITSLGPLAPLVFVAGYALVVPAPVPKSVLTTVAGVAFGLRLGIPLVVAGATLGAVLAFGIARVLGRDAVDRLARGHLDRVDAAIVRHGILAALVIRFVPILPFTLLNYACGVTAMRLRHYVLGTALGLVPGTSAVVALGSSGAQLSLWVPVLTSVGLGLLSLGVGAVWHHRSTAAARGAVTPGTAGEAAGETGSVVAVEPTARPSIP
jgi:uncharacterized membrane protein YdjX (TVP38/TMEM64 family)